MHFPNDGSVGLLLVTFAMKEEDVPNRVQMVRETLSRASEVPHPSDSGHCFFSRFDVVVPSDPRCDERDCGATAEQLRQELPEGASIHAVNGDPFVFSKNWGLAHQLSMGCRFTLTLSPESRGYVNGATMSALWGAVNRGPALAAGGILPALCDTIQCGRLAGTLALWNTAALLTVGGFDAEAARSSRETNRYLAAMDDDGNPVLGSRLDGVEEVVPLARLASHVGPCIAVITPTLSEGFEPYEEPTDPELLARHQKKLREKAIRQDAHLLRAGFDPSILERAVLSQHR